MRERERIVDPDFERAQEARRRLRAAACEGIFDLPLPRNPYVGPGIALGLGFLVGYSPVCRTLMLNVAAGLVRGIAAGWVTPGEPRSRR